MCRLILVVFCRCVPFAAAITYGQGTPASWGFQCRLTTLTYLGSFMTFSLGLVWHPWSLLFWNFQLIGLSCSLSSASLAQRALVDHPDSDCVSLVDKYSFVYIYYQMILSLWRILAYKDFGTENGSRESKPVRINVLGFRDAAERHSTFLASMKSWAWFLAQKNITSINFLNCLTI